MRFGRHLAASFTGALLFFGAGQVCGATVLMSDLINDKGSITVGDLRFDSFLATAVNSVAPTLVEVSSVTDGLGHAGLQFSSPLSIADHGGSGDIDADFLFTVTENTVASRLHSLTQSFIANVSGSGIAAFDFTRVDGSLINVALNCIGNVSVCPQDTLLMGDVGSAQVEREVQLVRGGSASGAGNITSWNVTFGEAPVTSAVPEPSTWLLMIVGMAGLGIVCRRRRGWRPVEIAAARSFHFLDVQGRPLPENG